MEKYNLDIKENGVHINETLINEEIFQKELHEYKAIEREDEIEHLMDWIGEAKDRPNDLHLMKEDLKCLINLKDTYLLSSISTNDYIAKSDDRERFNEICEELLKLNKQY